MVPWDASYGSRHVPRVSCVSPVSGPLRLCSSLEGIPVSQTTGRSPTGVPGMPRESVSLGQVSPQSGVGEIINYILRSEGRLPLGSLAGSQWWLGMGRELQTHTALNWRKEENPEGLAPTSHPAGRGSEGWLCSSAVCLTRTLGKVGGRGVQRQRVPGGNGGNAPAPFCRGPELGRG